ncbi:hypothetical protein L3X38_024839 [Prunus dulcis]|uniref:Uncharacterized protein n=1 Tax=Prunus dulcis TaxID=3755 RepID=A0AAD4W1D8_PRUDU|nr:hypothetical protein L3X38_024839 [Prunus dulcis]
MFVRVCLEVDLTKPLKRCLILGDEPKETRIYISYEALFAICFYCSQKKESGHDFPVKISNKNYLQGERLNNEPSFFPRDLVLDEDVRRNLQDDVILVFPQPITVDDIHKNENGEEVEEDNLQNTEEKEVGWKVVSGRKGKGKGAMRDGRTFKEVARGIRITDESSAPIPKVFFKDDGPSRMDKGKMVVSDPNLSLEEHSSSNAKAFKSPKKRARELFEEAPQESEPSVEILGVSYPFDHEDFNPNP